DGDDTATWNPGDGSDVIEGQTGNDTLLFSGANIAEKIELSANGARLRLTRDVANITMDTFSLETVTVRALGGVDNVIIDDLTGTSVAQVNVDLGASVPGGDGAADIVTINGTAGSDTFSAVANGSALDVSALGAIVHVINGEPANDR